MIHRTGRRAALASLMGLALFLGCDSKTGTTTPAPAGHEGNANGPAGVPLATPPAK